MTLLPQPFRIGEIRGPPTPLGVIVQSFDDHTAPCGVVEQEIPGTAAQQSVLEVPAFREGPSLQIHHDGRPIPAVR